MFPLLEEIFYEVILFSSRLQGWMKVTRSGHLRKLQSGSRNISDSYIAQTAPIIWSSPSLWNHGHLCYCQRQDKIMHLFLKSQELWIMTRLATLVTTADVAVLSCYGAHLPLLGRVQIQWKAPLKEQFFAFRISVISVNKNSNNKQIRLRHREVR